MNIVYWNSMRVHILLDKVRRRSTTPEVNTPKGLPSNYCAEATDVPGTRPSTAELPECRGLKDNCPTEQRRSTDQSNSPSLIRFHSTSFPLAPHVDQTCWLTVRRANERRCPTWRLTAPNKCTTVDCFRRDQFTSNSSQRRLVTLVG